MTYSDHRPTGSGAHRRPARRLLLVLAALAALLTAGSAHKQYTVQPGDTLEEIAERHGTAVSVLMGENGLDDPNRIVAGATLGIPEESGTTHHVVRPGETLTSISRRYGVAVDQLVEWNGLSSHTVFAGSRISVAGPAAQNVATGGTGSYRVAPGETLSAIARALGVGTAELADANDLADPDRIVAGATLQVPGGGWTCPVSGPRSFINDFGVTKPSGRFHDGVDIFAPRGTPVVAPVAGYVEHVTGARAGLQFRLHGADGHVYIGTHMDSFGTEGEVAAGDVLGTVGTSGNARGTAPHLHFEIRIDGERLANPYPSLREAC